MAYEDEVKLFYEWVQIWHETNEIKASEINLWHALMHTWLHSGCPSEFAVAISTLEKKTGLKRDAIYSARNKLKQRKRIDWIERKGNLSSIYKLVSFIPTQTPTQNEFVSVYPTQVPTQPPTQTPTQVPTISSSNSIYINNNTTTDNVSEKPTQTPTQNEFVSDKPIQTPTQDISIGLNDTSADTNQADNRAPDPFKYYEQLFGLLRPVAVEEIKDYLQNGLENRLICLAMDKSHENGAGHWNYAKAILDSCVMDKVLTVAAFIKKEKQFKAKKAEKKQEKLEPSKKKNRFANFEGREIDYTEIERKEQEYIAQMAAAAEEKQR